MQLSLFQRYRPPAPRYGGHEDQPVQRFWLPRAVAAVQANPRCFEGVGACLQWGMSAARLRSLLFWALAFKVIVPQGSPGCYVVTPWGQQLLGIAGLDPYLEDPASLWLLHWQLLQPPCYAQVWGWFFGTPQHPATEAGLLVSLKAWAEGRGPVAESRLRADLKCLLKMYCPPPQSVEDALLNLYGDVPLIRDDGAQFTRLTGPRAGLSTAVLLYCCLDYAHNQPAVKVTECAYGAGSPGMVFGLSSSHLLEALGHATAHQPGITLSSSIDGGYQLRWAQSATALKQQVWASLASGAPWTQR